jgi:ferredoxin-nitrite reductase
MKLNKIEKAKNSLVPYDFYKNIALLDLTDLTEEERFYLKSFGIYNIKLNPERFMLRLRIAGGRIDTDKLRFIAKIVQQYELELLLTARAQIELHGLKAQNILNVWELLQQKEIITLQTLTDNFRNIVTDSYDGLDESTQIEVYPLLIEMQNIFLGKKEWMGMLPRKFNTAICGNKVSQMYFFANDLFFGLARKGDIWGFNIYLGGKNSEVAKDADIFVKPHEVPLMFEAVSKAYMKYSLRGSRAKIRLFHLILEIGMDAFVKRISEFYPENIEKKGILQMYKAPVSEFQALKDGTFAYCYQSRFGKIGATALLEFINYADKENAEVRVGVDQNLYLLGIKKKKVPFGHILGASHVTACAGSHYCSLSLWDVKEETSYLPLEEIEAHNIQVGFSGCLKGCGRHYHTDIGLVGLRTNLFGETQKAARVFLGGEYSRGEKAARLIFGVVPLVHLKSVFEVIIEEFEASAEEDFEDFSRKYLNPLSISFLLLWFLAKLYLKKQITLDLLPEEELYQKLSVVKDFPKFTEDEKYQKSIGIMLHSLWDDVTQSS